MRILFGTDNFYPNVNGAANFTYALINGLVERGHDIHVIAPSQKFKNMVTRNNGITVHGIRSMMIPKIIHPSGLRISLPVSSIKIKKMVEEIKPDVIHIQDHFILGSKVANAGRKLGIPMMGTNHFMPENFIHYLQPFNFAKIPLSKIAWKAFINVYKNLDLITVPTKTAALMIKNLGLKNPITIISCGIDLRRFNPKNNGAYLKKHYKISNFKPIVLFVGRLDKEKNIDVLIKAFAKVLTSIDAQLVIAGSGKEKLNLVTLSKKTGNYKNITFTGFVPDKDLPYLYTIADVFAIASIAELQSIATLEAMASGLPVVAAKVMALPELVHDGKNGFLFNNGDIDDLAGKIMQILKNPNLAKKMSGMSLKIISQHNINQTIKKYKEIYSRFSKT